jgi:hypothetical protein
MSDIGATYVYYKKAILREHMLYQTEIAKKYGIKSNTNRDHSRLVGAILQVYVTEHPNDGYEEFYYMTNQGLARVYQELMYSTAIKWFADLLKLQGSSVDHVLIDGTLYKFKWNYSKI